MHGFQGNERILKDAVRAVPANVLNAVLLPELRKNEEVEQFLDLEKRKCSRLKRENSPLTVSVHRRQAPSTDYRGR